MRLDNASNPIKTSKRHRAIRMRGTVSPKVDLAIFLKENIHPKGLVNIKKIEDSLGH